MDCLNCGAETNGTSALCPRCFEQRRQAGPRRDSQEFTTALNSGFGVGGRAGKGAHGKGVSNDGWPPAGFWLRFLAFYIDSFILIILLGVLAVILGLLIGVSMFGLVTSGFMTGEDPNSWSMVGGIIGILVAGVGIFVLFGILYYALTESSRLQASPGKLIVGLRIVDDYGERISFLRALGRTLLRSLFMFFGLLVLYLPFLMIGFSQSKQGLHDLVCGTHVDRSPNLGVGRILLSIAIALILTVIYFGLTAGGSEKPGKLVERTLNKHFERMLPASTPKERFINKTSPESSFDQPVVTPVAEEPEVDQEVPLTATVNGKAIQFDEVSARYDQLTDSVTVALSSDGDTSKISMNLRFTFASNATECTADSLESYTVEFLSTPGGFVLPRNMKNLEFSRIGSWRRSSEMPALSCELNRGGLFQVILQDDARSEFDGVKHNFAWNLGFQAVLK